MSASAGSLRVAVTGAAGHLGGAVLEQLLSHPAVERVVALDTAPLERRDAKLEFHPCDVTDPEIGRYLAGCDVLLHLAFIVERGSRDQERVQRVNVDGTRNVCEAAAREGLRQVVFASSISVYGIDPSNDGVSLGEEAPLLGDRHFYYPRTKVEAERVLDAFEKEHPEIRVARLRPSVFLGGGRRTAALRSRLPFQPYLPEHLAPLHITHQDDVARAFVLALENDAQGAFNVANELPLTVREMAQVLGKRPLAVPEGLVRLYRRAYGWGLGDVDPDWLDFATQQALLVSSDKIRKELGWRPVYPTAADALRAVAGRPNTGASPAARRFLGTLVRISRLFGALPASERDRADARGMSGSVNLVLTGEQPSQWRFVFQPRGLAVRPGSDPDARATLILLDRTFRRLLAGELDTTTAQMTGKVRLRGDGEMMFLLGVLVEQFRQLRGAAGPRGLLARRYAAWVLAGSGPPAGDGGSG